MSLNRDHGLPFLPGNTFPDITKSAFHRSQTLDFKKGYTLPRRPRVGIGQSSLLSDELTQNKMNELSPETPVLTYGTALDNPYLNFIPAHVAYNNKVLRFYAYFQQEVMHSPDEEYRVRPVVIYYFLEDDSMRIIEPVVENSGIWQGKLIKRQRLPKNDRGDHYHWKDLNVAVDLTVYGTTYHVTHCDAFTQEFMESEGLILNEPEATPVDPYVINRVQLDRSYITPSEFDPLHQFLTFDRKVLRFFALWDHTDSLYGEARPVTIQFYLADDTVEIRDVHEVNCGRDPFPLMLRRQKLPKQIKAACEPFPTCVMEVTSQEVQEYYSPKDFKVGETLRLLGRRFLLYDCDDFTKAYYREHYPDMLLKPTKVSNRTDVLEEKKRDIPPYNGFGSLEDSFQNCLSLVPEPPKKDLVKMLENNNKVLRYAATMDSQNPQDAGRRFILFYYPSNDMISIFEKPTRNSGIIAGKFLEKIRIPKPGCSVDQPVFYTPADFAIGATVEVLRHRFVLTDADQYVLKYLESMSDQIPSETLASHRRRHGMLKGSGDETHVNDQHGTSHNDGEVVAEPSS